MAGCCVWLGTPSRAVWLSGAMTAGRMALGAGDGTSCFMPLSAGGEPAVLVGAAEGGAAVAESPRVPENGFAVAKGVVAFPIEDARDGRPPAMLSRT